MYSSARSVAVGGGATSEAVEQVEHAAAPDPDRIIGRKHLEIADRARPLESAKDDVIGVGGRLAGDKSCRSTVRCSGSRLVRKVGSRA